MFDALTLRRKGQRISKTPCLPSIIYSHNKKNGSVGGKK